MMAYLIAWLSQLAGMLALAVSLESHWRQLGPQPLPAPGYLRGLRTAGLAAQLLGLLLCLYADPPSIAVLVWGMLATLAALQVTALFSYVPHRLARALRRGPGGGRCG